MRLRAHTNAIWSIVGVMMLALLVLPLVGCGGGGSTAVIDPDPDPDPGPDPIENMNPETAAAMLAAWETSGHADFEAEAFRHWDEDGAVPTSCARCHSTGGYRDYLGADGSAPFQVDAAAPLGTTVNCDACHNDAAWTLDTVIFPSGAIATGLGAEARCMTCHQGRESTVSMNTHIAAALVPDDDTVDADLRFRNIHYFAAGATLYGGAVKGGYQYTEPGLDGVVGTPDDEIKYGYYDRRNPHVAKADTCIECHDPHTLERRISLCAECHTGVTSDADLRNIRMAGSVRDYDGDGNSTEGIYYEIQTLQGILYSAMQAYATSVLGAPIMYDSHAYPYYFNDNGGGASYGNRYQSWSARLLRAAYNYQYAQKDPGAFAHNPKYVIELLYDSIADLHAHPGVTVPNFDALWRNDSGHFDAGAEAFRHWDRPADEISEGSIDQGDVSSSCARCHSPGGFDFYAEYGLDLPTSTEVGDGFRCEQCHVEGADFTGTPEVKYVSEVAFPSGDSFDNDAMNPDTSFLCMACHQGRESGPDVEAMVEGGGSLRFLNVHYLPAGATLYGADARGAYQYRTGPSSAFPYKTYAGKWNHFGGVSSQCAFCHLEDHTFEPQAAPICGTCHGSGTALEDYRIGRATDYDGDGNNTERLKDEVATFATRLYAAIQSYATGFLGAPITYDSHAYPYWFNDNGGGANYGNRYNSWDPALLKAAYNYQYWAKEPGAWAHNTHYILQVLYDSILDLSGNTTGLTRP